MKVLLDKGQGKNLVLVWQTTLDIVGNSPYKKQALPDVIQCVENSSLESGQKEETINSLRALIEQTSL